jgi:hypothetical protein
LTSARETLKKPANPSRPRLRRIKTATTTARKAHNAPAQHSVHANAGITSLNGITIKGLPTTNLNGITLLNNAKKKVIAERAKRNKVESHRGNVLSWKISHADTLPAAIHNRSGMGFPQSEMRLQR